MCTELLPPGDYPIAVDKYIISYIKQLTDWVAVNCPRNRQIGIKAEQMIKCEGDSSTHQGCSGVDVKGVALSSTNIVEM
jgi:hypothetical protein